MSKQFVMVVLALLVLLATAYAAKTDMELRSAFGAYVSKFAKNYTTSEEYEARFQLYAANSARAEQLTQQSGTAVFSADNQFGDWSKAEREAYLGRLPSDRKSHVKSTHKPTAPLAVESFDLVQAGAVGDVKDQGQCGSCWAFSTTEGVTSAALKAGYPMKVADDLSFQQLVSCDKYDAGCNGGDLPSAFQALQDMGGYMSGTDYPYTARDGTCQFKKDKVVVPVTGFEWVIPTCERGDCEKQDINKFLSNVKTTGVAPSICVYVSDDWFYYKSGVFNLPCSADYYDLNHCILFTGYSAEEQAVTVMNSWGKSWGLDGFMKISTKESNPNLCGWADEATFGLVKK